MEFQRSRLPTTLLVLGLFFCGLGGCSSNDGPGAGVPKGTGGAVVSTGGFADTGGARSTGGTKGSGGTQESGGTIATGDTGGNKSTGGTSTGGVITGGSVSGGTTTGGSSTGGSAATGGSGKGGSSSDAATGGADSGGQGGTGDVATADTGGTPSGSCQKGVVKAKEVLIMGESFYAMGPQYIQKRIEENAKKAGAIGAGDSYRNVAISGQPMSVVAGEFDTGLGGGAVKAVIMDGGGIDCMSSACDSCPGIFKTLLTKMASNGVQEVIYTRYPEPGNPPGSNATLKKNLDTLMPKMQPVCESATGLRCHWVDLRPVWVNGDTTDGLHPTQSGGNHVGDAIWAEMVKDCIAQ